MLPCAPPFPVCQNLATFAFTAYANCHFILTLVSTRDMLFKYSNDDRASLVIFKHLNFTAIGKGNYRAY